jgi:putative two-component system protein, hydrogenase maturation factor HypX/HoxX
MRILFLVSAHNSLSQRTQIALTELGHDIDVAVVATALEMEAAVARHRPELIVCPMLKAIIPESIFQRHRCLIVHPGPKGDRGPSSLDWAIELRAPRWGVTVLEASAEIDGGDIWASRTFRMRDAGKSSLYRHEVRRAAIEAVVQAVQDVAAGDVEPTPLDPADVHAFGRPRPLIKQAERAIDWATDSTDTILRRIRAAEGHPGVLDTIAGEQFHLFGAHPEATLRGRPGEIVAQRHGAICRATVDGAVWIAHLKRPDGFKLPAALALDIDVPEAGGWDEIAY